MKRLTIILAIFIMITTITGCMEQDIEESKEPVSKSSSNEFDDSYNDNNDSVPESESEESNEQNISVPEDESKGSHYDSNSSVTE